MTCVTRRILITAAILVSGVCARAADDVVLQLKWIHQAQFAGYYYALERGFYQEEGLSVRLIEGGPGIDKIGQVMDGAADFAVDSPENLLIHRARGDEAVAIAAIFQQNPLVFIAQAESGIVRPRDCLDRTAAILDADLADLQFRAIFERLGLDIGRVVLTPYEYDHAGFLDGRAEITLSYINGGVIRLRRMGLDLRLIWPGDYGVHAYADTLITTRRLLDERPDRVVRFLRATLRGWEEAIRDPEAAVEAIMRYAREADRTLQTEMMVASIPLVYTGRTAVGSMDPATWASMHDMLVRYGILERALNVSAAYDLGPLTAVLGGERR